MIHSIMYDCEPRIQKQLTATYDYWNILLKIVVELKSSMWSTVSEDFYRVNKNAIKQYKGDLQFFSNCILI